MKTKILVIAIAAGVGIAIGFLTNINRSGPSDVATGQSNPPSKVAPKIPVMEAQVAGEGQSQVTQEISSNVQVEATAPTDETNSDQPLVINGYVVQDPMARAALSFVGADPDADAYWMAAINDPNLPSEERKDLIEDLNEDGLMDPKHPGPQDAPLIAARIELIENLAPYAIDEADADAFAEADKDLVRMLNGRAPQ